MYLSDSQVQELGFWSTLIGAAVNIGGKVVDRNIQKKNFAIEKARAEIEEKRAQLELTKLTNQRKIAELQHAREQSAFQQQSGSMINLPNQMMNTRVAGVPVPLLAASALLAILILRK